ncbi:3-deoxy-manno-octulosonate cytidylyltransferase [Bacteroidota bacterium]
MIIGIIPARFASTRLMGKPLADIGGKPLIQHTYENASNSKLLKKIIIAVDDEKVREVCQKFGAEVVMTAKEFASGSDRVSYVANKKKKAEIIVNIQGDEPFISGNMIDEAIEPLLFDKDVNISTLAKRIETLDELQSPDIVKVVFDYNNYAMYFSRSPIPHVRDTVLLDNKIEKNEFYKHIGLYVYRRDHLIKFTKLTPTDLEKTEKLEQLRMLENGLKIKIVVTGFESIGVDTPEDLKRARAYYKRMKSGKVK